MAGKYYEDGLWVSQGDPALVNEQVTTDIYTAPSAGATRQFVAGQLGKKINLPVPTNSGALVANEYRYVLRDDTTTFNTVPCVLEWKSSALFSVELGAGHKPIAGIFLGNDTATTGQQGMQSGNYGFIQIGGVAYVQAGGTCTAGGDLTTTSNGLVRDRTVFTEPLVGIALGSSSGGTTAVLLTIADLP